MSTRRTQDPALPAHTVQVAIERDWRTVCDALAEPRHLARWASWLGVALRQRDGDWVVEHAGVPPAKVRFTERNAFGVADHCLVHDDERATFVALRAIANGAGTEVVLTFFGAAVLDAQRAARDLRALKSLLESAARDQPARTGRHNTHAPVFGSTAISVP